MSARQMNPARNAAKSERKTTHIVSPARRAAFAVLRRVEEEAAFASVLLASNEDELRAEDRALCQELVLGVLRRQLWLDALIQHYAKRDAANLDAPVRLALRLGLYQLRFLERIPASAAVNESVNLAKQSRLHSAASFINAVLRRATREPGYDPAANVADPIKRLSIETSHPAWLIERWTKMFGTEETRSFAYANNEPPPIAFRFVASNNASSNEADESRAVLDELRAAGAELKASAIAPGAWRVKGAGSLLRQLAREGKIYLQDEASQLVAHVLNVRTGERVLDVCAAPGSKTTHIAALSRNQSSIIACDIREHRLRTLRESCLRQHAGSIQLVGLDATRPLPFAEQSFDRVLVDAPCTGTGTLRRNPEIRWRIKFPDIVELAKQQQLILASAAQMVRPGGRLLYSTCSIEPEENEAVVEKFLTKQSAFKKIQIPLVPEGLRTNSGAARTWPQRDGADGFFIACFERQSGAC